MAKQPHVAIYARVSTDEQNVDVQLNDLREYVRNRGWELVHEYVDQGISGAKDSRPAFNELWDAILKGRVHVLVVHALDRVGRSLPHLVRVISTLAERNITLISFRENLDLSTAQGRMLAGLFSVLADYELSLIRERTPSRHACRQGPRQPGRQQDAILRQEEGSRVSRPGLGAIERSRKPSGLALAA